VAALKGETGSKVIHQIIHFKGSLESKWYPPKIFHIKKSETLFGGRGRSKHFFFLIMVPFYFNLDLWGQVQKSGQNSHTKK
jgi:hypothetical protein